MSDVKVVMNDDYFKYAVLKSSWGICIYIKAEIKESPSPLAVQVAEGLWLDRRGRFIDYMIDREFKLMQDGLKMMAPKMPKTVICINRLDYNPCDYQEDGLPYAMANWVAQKFGVEPPKVNIKFENRRYVFEEKNSMSTVTLTEKAAKELKRTIVEQQEKGETAKLYLRVRVTGGGCSGFQNKLDLTSDVSTEKDEFDEQHGVPIVVDKRSKLYAEGSIVDWVEDLNRRGFSIVNPNVKSTCGCGSSFSM